MRVLARWWWFASLLVHAVFAALVAAAPPTPGSTRDAPGGTIEFEPSQPPPMDVRETRDGTDAGVRTTEAHPTPIPLGGSRAAQNLDTVERGEGGDRRSLERGRLLAARAEGVSLSTDLQNTLAAQQVQRMRTARRRESWQNDRRTPHEGDEPYVSVSIGELLYRAPSGPRPAIGRERSPGPAQRAGDRPVDALPPGQTTPMRVAVPAGSVARSAAGALQAIGTSPSATGRAARAQAHVEQGHAATTSERLAPRAQDDTDAAALATSLARDALNATVHDGAERAQGVGGVGGGGRAGVGGGVGEGGRAEALGEGSGARAAGSEDARYRRYYLALRRALQRRVRGAFPERAALDLEEGRVMVDLRVETDGLVRVQGFTRHSGIAEFDENVRRALDGFRAPSIPADVSTAALRIIFDHSVESPIVR